MESICISNLIRPASGEKLRCLSDRPCLRLGTTNTKRSRLLSSNAISLALPSSLDFLEVELFPKTLYDTKSQTWNCQRNIRIYIQIEIFTLPIKWNYNSHFLMCFCTFYFYFLLFFIILFIPIIAIHHQLLILYCTCYHIFIWNMWLKTIKAEMLCLLDLTFYFWL